MNIVQLIADKTSELANNGTIDKIIETHVTSCIDDIIKDQFKWTGAGKEALETAIKSKLELPLDKINIATYQLAITKHLETQLNNSVFENAKSDINKIISDLTGVLDKKEFCLSEIIAKYIDSLDKSYDGDMED